MQTKSITKSSNSTEQIKKLWLQTNRFEVCSLTENKTKIS